MASTTSSTGGSSSYSTSISLSASSAMCGIGGRDRSNGVAVVEHLVVGQNVGAEVAQADRILAHLLDLVGDVRHVGRGHDRVTPGNASALLVSDARCGHGHAGCAASWRGASWADGCRRRSARARSPCRARRGELGVCRSRDRVAPFSGRLCLLWNAPSSLLGFVGKNVQRNTCGGWPATSRRCSAHARFDAILNALRMILMSRPVVNDGREWPSRSLMPPSTRKKPPVA